MAASQKKPADGENHFLTFRPEKISLVDLFGLAFLRKSLVDIGFVECSDSIKQDFAHIRPSWLQILAFIASKVLIIVGPLMKFLGNLVEFTLNLLLDNGGLTGLVLNFFKGTLKKPVRGSENYRSMIAILDWRTGLDNENDFSLPSNDTNYAPGWKPLDFYIMNAKLAYENDKFIQKIVTKNWNMHFHEFFDCLNGTQAFVITDKPTNASLIIVAFRGTEPFSAQDWLVDADLSFFSLGEGMGKVHTGFMLALGMRDGTTFEKRWPKSNSEDDRNAKPRAYYAVRESLRTLLVQHREAQIVVTGHSLGAALAILFPSLLVLHEENDLLARLRGVVTFGQPRVGDEVFASLLVGKFNYFRVVFRYDIVTRVPFEEPSLPFRHFGRCVYFNSWYNGQVMKEAPNKNYFGVKYFLSKHKNAVSDFIRGATARRTLGEGFRESLACGLFRSVGLLIPGLASHSPVDYVNAAKLASVNIPDFKIYT